MVHFLKHVKNWCAEKQRGWKINKDKKSRTNAIGAFTPSSGPGELEEAN